MHLTLADTRIVATVSRRALPCMLLLSLTVNVVQARRLRTLAALPPLGPVVGTVVPSVSATTSGRQTTELLDERGRMPTILYYFSASCGWCERNWPNVVALERATRHRYRFLALSASDVDLREVAERHGLGFQLHNGSDAYAALGLRGTPHTMVLSPQGRVQVTWVGAFDRTTGRQVERYFGVSLPGLAPAPASKFGEP